MTVQSIVECVTQVGIAVFRKDTGARLWANDCFMLFMSLLPPGTDVMAPGYQVVATGGGHKMRVHTEGSVHDAGTVTVVLEALGDQVTVMKGVVEVMDVATDGFWQWYVQDNREVLSPRFWATLGYDVAAQQHCPKSWMHLLHPEDLTRVMASFKAHVESHGATPHYNLVRYTHREGHTLWILCRGAVVEWDGDKPVLMVGTHTDVSAVMKGEETETAARELAERKAMVNYVFHEVRNPINTLSTGLELLRHEIRAGAPANTLLELTKTMARAVSRSVHVLNDTLEYSKLENGRFSLDLAEHNLVNITNDVVAEFETEANDAGIELLTQFSTRRAVIVCDHLRLRQILINLLSNALKFTPAGGTVTVALRMGEDDVTVVVRDTGVGIPAEQLDAIWEPYTQLAKGGGVQASMGLGLTICRMLVRSHHGHLTVQSEAGRGTAFTLTLPRIQLDSMCEKVKMYTSRTQSSSSDEDDGGLHFHDAHVMVVEDDPINRAMLSKLLASRGITVTTAKDGRDFVDAVCRGVPRLDLVLLDELMPRMNGTAALRVARQEFGFNKPVVFLTGSDLEEHRAKFRAVGANDVLTKPVNVVALFSALAKHLMGKVVAADELAA